MLRLTEIAVLHAIGFYFLFNGRVAVGLGKQIKAAAETDLKNYYYFDQLTDKRITYYYSSTAFLGLVSGRCGWLMHEGGHYSLTGNIMCNSLI